ncbi:FtsX-like permease family protein [Streptomyces sp. NPDC057682]|uniref:FtsX-like permease family protein n=1 Tax=Streptomyces sp. NPDC057682 TaxID=3346210 RepID=UPI0036864076
MLSVLFSGLRARWVTLAGSFLALALGVGTVAATGLALAATFDAPHRGPQRFAAAPVVVRGADRLEVPTPVGVRTRKLTSPRPVPPAVVTALARLGPTVEDRTFPVSVTAAARLDADGTGPVGRPGPVPDGTGRLDDSRPVPDGTGPVDHPRPVADGTGPVGHPWPVAAATPYRLTAGRAPAAPGEVVVTAGPGSGVRPGDRITVTTPRFTGPRTVVGTVRPAGFETAVFFTASEAARISPAVDAVVVHAPAAAVRTAVAAADRAAPATPDVTAPEATTAPLAVLTGDDRRRADPDPDRDAEALVSVNALLGTAAGITAFVSLLVVASTFSYAVAQRRREIGLLRTAGATPGQVRRTVYAEALLVGVLASAAGVRLGMSGAPRLAALMRDEGIAPGWFAIGERNWPLHTAFWTGLAVALLGSVLAARRAGKVAPVEALRESDVDSGTMPLSRVVLGAAVLLAGIALPLLALVRDPADLLARKTYVTQPMVLITGFALFAPVLVRPVTRLLLWLPSRLPTAVPLLTRENACAALRRTAAVAAPVLVTTAMAASLLGTTATLAGARAAEADRRSAADFVAVAGGGAVPAAFVDRARAVPGAVVSASRSTSLSVLEEGTALITSEARGVDPADAAAVSSLPLVAGDLADLDDGSVIVNEEWATHRMGARVTVWLGDGRRTTLRIAGVMRTGTGGNGVYVTPRNAGGARIDRVEVKVRAGADRSAVAARLAAAGEATGTTVTARSEALADEGRSSGRNTRVGLLMILLIALVHTGIALAAVQVMATAGRVRDLAVLRLAGATRAQVLRAVAAEALAVVAVGAVLGGAVAGLNLLGVRAALGRLGADAGIVVPWGTLGLVVAVNALVAVVAAVLPAALALRVRPAEHVGAGA